MQVYYYSIHKANDLIRNSLLKPECHAASGPPPQLVPWTIYGNFVTIDGPPGPSMVDYGCHRWSCLATSGHPCVIQCYMQ